MELFVISVLLCTALRVVARDENPREEIYCQWDTFEPKCKANEVIVMNSALYGRMERVHCMDKDFGFIGCSTDVLYLADARCSGRTECSISIPDQQFANHSTCPKDLIMYLSASYSCLQVIRPVPGECSFKSPIRLVAPYGYLASITTEQTGCGGTETPWLIQAQPGQAIRFTLYDYALDINWIKMLNGTVAVPKKTASCTHVYATLKEKHTSQGMAYTVCRGDKRQELVHQTSSNEVEVRMRTGTTFDHEFYFLLKYEVVGCPDIEISSSTWAERSGNKVTIGCSTSSRKWLLTCNGTHWIGHRGNCTERTGAATSSEGPPLIPKPLSIVVIIAVAMVIGSLILVIGIFCLKSRRDSRPAGSQGRGIQSKDSDAYPPPYSDSMRPSFLGRQDPSTENEYEYVEDIIKPPFKPPSPPVVPPGEFKSTCAIHGRSGFITVSNSSVGHNNNKTVPSYVDHHHEYTTTAAATNGAGIPQYYELEAQTLEKRDGANSAMTQPSGFATHRDGGSTSETHWHKAGSLGHYSQ